MDDVNMSHISKEEKRINNIKNITHTQKKRYVIIKTPNAMITTT